MTAGKVLMKQYSDLPFYFHPFVFHPLHLNFASVSVFFFLSLTHSLAVLAYLRCFSSHIANRLWHENAIKKTERGQLKLYLSHLMTT